MRDGDAIGDIRVGIAIDVRNAEFVADDFRGIGAVGQRQGVALGPEGFPRRQRDEYCKHQHEQRNARAP